MHRTATQSNYGANLKFQSTFHRTNLDNSKRIKKSFHDQARQTVAKLVVNEIDLG